MALMEVTTQEVAMIWFLTHKSNNKGFTLVELVLSLTLFSFFSIISISYISKSIDEKNFHLTIKKLNLIRDALVGQNQVSLVNTKQKFGYIGDIGGLPTAIETLGALQVKPAGQSVWAANSTHRIAFGWSGAYLQDTTLDGSDLKDAWGNNFVYSPATIPPLVTSLGADGLVGGSGFDEDINFRVPWHISFSNVHGFILDGGAPWSGTAEVEINFPDGAGALSQVTTNLVPSDNGYFVFNNIPQGTRSATIYIPSKGSPVSTIGPFVFTVNEGHFVIPVGLTDVASILRNLKTLYTVVYND